MTRAVINTEEVAERMRARIIRPQTREILITLLEGSAQEGDLTSPVNCGGVGRVRHFRREVAPGWPQNFLPIEPATKALELGSRDLLEAQVFQNAACAWRCWYCYVPFELLGGDERRAEWITAAELVRRYAELTDRPLVLDLSGGSPDLTPEWIPWTIEALNEEGIADQTYLWSDDNLSTDLVFTALSEQQRKLMATYPRYGRVCCFKGFDRESFAFNTGADPNDFDLQFERFSRYTDLGFNLYAYVTLTGPSLDGVAEKVERFIQRLHTISPTLVTRIVPLRVEKFGPMVTRMSSRDFNTPLQVQEVAINTWSACTKSARHVEPPSPVGSNF